MASTLSLAAAETTSQQVASQPSNEIHEVPAQSAYQGNSASVHDDKPLGAAQERLRALTAAMDLTAAEMQTNAGQLAELPDFSREYSKEAAEARASSVHTLVQAAALLKEHEQRHRRWKYLNWMLRQEANAMLACSST